MKARKRHPSWASRISGSPSVATGMVTSRLRAVGQAIHAALPDVTMIITDQHVANAIAGGGA